jgi:hypothetical protein
VWVADDVDDLRPIDDDEPLLVKQHVVGREIAVRPAVEGEPGQGLAQLLEQLGQQSRIGPRLNQPRSRLVTGADELHQDLGLLELHRVGDR